MTSETIDVLYFIFLKFMFTKIIFKPKKKNVFGLQIFFILINCNKLSIKNKSFQKSTKINAFEQKICICHSQDDDSQHHIPEVCLNFENYRNVFVRNDYYYEL